MGVRGGAPVARVVGSGVGTAMKGRSRRVGGSRGVDLRYRYDGDETPTEILGEYWGAHPNESGARVWKLTQHHRAAAASPSPFKPRVSTFPAALARTLRASGRSHTRDPLALPLSRFTVQLSAPSACGAANAPNPPQMRCTPELLHPWQWRNWLLVIRHDRSVHGLLVRSRGHPRAD